MELNFSIIVPTLNEEIGIQACLSALQAQRGRCEIIVVDGGSTDQTRTLAGDLADQVIVSEAGRAKQMNLGARHASGTVLLFLHADTFLPDNALDLIQEHLEKEELWGRFDIQLNDDHCLLTIIACMMNWRSRLSGIATGDQALFVKRRMFFMAGSYPEIALMEDIALSKALKKISPPLCLPAKVVSSARKWRQEGIVRTMVLMWKLRLDYFFGADPRVLAQRYDRRKIWKP